jgi:hypothetical protein
MLYTTKYFVNQWEVERWMFERARDDVRQVVFALIFSPAFFHQPMLAPDTFGRQGDTMCIGSPFWQLDLTRLCCGGL